MFKFPLIKVYPLFPMCHRIKNITVLEVYYLIIISNLFLPHNSIDYNTSKKVHRDKNIKQSVYKRDTVIEQTQNEYLHTTGTKSKKVVYLLLLNKVQNKI